MRRLRPSRLPARGVAALAASILAGAFTASGSATPVTHPVPEPTGLAAAHARAASTLTPWHGVPVALGSLAPAELVQAQMLGADEVEVFAQWSAIEAAGPGIYDQEALDELDEVVDGAATLGLKVTLRVRGTPCWTSTEPPEARAKRPDLCPAYPPVNPASYGNFVAFLANRYAGKLAAIEVWAEEDHADGQHFAGPDAPGHYAALLQAAYTAVQRSTAPVPVLIGALVGAEGHFLKALYKDGIKGYYSGIAVDFYDLVLASLRAIHQVQIANGDHTPLWLEEFGWTTCSTPRSLAEEYFVCVSPQQQAQNLDDIVRGLAMVNWVQGMNVFTLRDNPSLHFGISNESGNPKPAFTMLQQAWHSNPLPPRGVTLRDRHRALQGTAPVGDTIELTVKPPHGRGKTYYANLRLTVDGTYSWPLPRRVGRGWRATAQEPWTHGVAHLNLK
jgi:polysaccharide biosynthesis protein PslG